MVRLLSAALALVCTFAAATLGYAQSSESYGWLNNETLKSRYGDFQFKNGYPVGDAASRLLETQMLNRAIEVYTTQMMGVSEIGSREGVRAFGPVRCDSVSFSGFEERHL